MTKPDWKDAPEWAQWLAQDSSGAWYWYERKPFALGTVWVDDGGRSASAIKFSREWESTIEQRPAVQP